jgi:hypothetical protein
MNNLYAYTFATLRRVHLILTHISPRIYGDVDGNVGMLAVFRTKVRVSG